MRNCSVALNNECFRFYKVVGDKEIDYSDRTKLPYVDATVMEIQRLANICELVIKPYEPRFEKTSLRGFRPGPTKTGLHRHRRWLEAEILDLGGEGLYYPFSENKGADHLRGYREADLRLCFRICKKPVFSQRGSYGFTSNNVKCTIIRFEREILKLFLSDRLTFYRDYQ